MRLAAAEDFAAGSTYQEIARKHRATKMSAWWWWTSWKNEGSQGLRSTGPASPCLLSYGQLRQLAALLGEGPAVHGLPDDPRWTLARVCELVARHFGYTYSLRGMSLLLHRLGYSPQVPGHSRTSLTNNGFHARNPCEPRFDGVGQRLVSQGGKTGSTGRYTDESRCERNLGDAPALRGRSPHGLSITRCTRTGGGNL